MCKLKSLEAIIEALINAVGGHERQCAGRACLSVGEISIEGQPDGFFRIRIAVCPDKPCLPTSVATFASGISASDRTAPLKLRLYGKIR